MKYSRSVGETEKAAAAFSKGTISAALWDAFDHKDSGDDNLIRVSKMPRYVTEKFGIEGDFYIYRDHAYENMVSKEDAHSAGRPVKRKGRDIHFHNLGIEKMTDALLSIEHPVMTIDDTRKEGNPQVVMMLDVQGNNNAPLYAVLSFYSDQPINGRFERKPHIVLTVAEKTFLESDGYGSWEEAVRRAIEDGRVLDFDKNKRTGLSVIAQRTRLGNITEGSLTESISQFRKKINAFKQKNKISYSRKTTSGGVVTISEGEMAKLHANYAGDKVFDTSRYKNKKRRGNTAPPFFFVLQACCKPLSCCMRVAKNSEYGKNDARFRTNVQDAEQTTKPHHALKIKKNPEKPHHC